MVYSNVIAAIERFGLLCVEEMKDYVSSTRQRRRGNGQLRSLRSNAVDTGGLLSSIRYQLTSSTPPSIEFQMAEHGIFVDKGRSPGKFPPLAKIEGWLERKGLPCSLAYPIAKKIAQEGIAARPFFSSTVERNLPAFLEELEAAYAMDINQAIKQAISK